MTVPASARGCPWKPACPWRPEARGLWGDGPAPPALHVSCSSKIRAGGKRGHRVEPLVCGGHWQGPAGCVASGRSADVVPITELGAWPVLCQRGGAA